MRYFAAASWSTWLRASSLLGVAILIGIGIAATTAIPHGTRVPFAQGFGTVIAFVPPAIALAAALFVVGGYAIESRTLRIRRLLWSTHLPLAGLTRVYADPALMRGSLRIFGNGGLFSFTGYYRSRALGTYRAFVTDPAHAVALVFPGRIVVVSPEDPAAFMRAIHAQCPYAQVGAPGAVDGAGSDAMPSRRRP